MKSPISAEMVKRSHLSGKVCLGFYLMRPDDTVYCSCIDLDNHNDENPNVAADTQKITERLDELGFDKAYLVELSQSGGGYHVWMFYDEPTPATVVRRFWKQVLQDTGVHAEIYPKQDSLKSTPKALGNLVRYPFWSHSHFIEWDGIDGGWVGTADHAPLSVSAVTERELENCIEWYEESTDTVVSSDGLPIVVENLIRQHPDALLARRWGGDRSGLADRSLSALALSLVHEMVRAYIRPSEIDQALDVWGKSFGYTKAQRAEWRRVTIEKAYDIVAGRIGKRQNSNTSGTLKAITKGYVDAVLRGEDHVISTGLDGLNESISGFGIGEYIIVGARPSHGKTALGLHFLDHAASQGHVGLFVSLEMTRNQVSERYAARIVPDVTKDTWGDEGVEESVKERIDAYFESRADIHYEGDCNKIDDLEKVVREYVEDKQVRFVVVDYLGCVQGPYGDEFKDMTHLSPRFKKMAKDLDIVMVVLVQFNRSIEKEDPDREPRFSDIRGSGQVEADADVILFPRWSFMYDALRPKEEYVIWASKCRNRGIKAKKVLVTFDSDRQLFK